MKKNKFCNLIFICLARGIAGLINKDKIITNDFDTLPIGFKINLGILPYGTYLGLIKTNSGFLIKKNGFATPDLIVTFKNTKSAKKVMLAKKSIAQSFSEHAIIVGGDIAQALVLVRIINRVECYLFPRFMTKNILPKIKKETCTLALYFTVLFKRFKYDESLLQGE